MVRYNTHLNTVQYHNCDGNVYCMRISFRIFAIVDPNELNLFHMHLMYSIVVLLFTSQCLIYISHSCFIIINPQVLVRTAYRYIKVLIN